MIPTAAFSAWTLIALAPLASAHMYMLHPTPFTLDQYDADRGPLSAGQYPCKFHDYQNWDSPTTLATGEAQTLELEGGAPHGGGSCQISITLDESPTADSVFKVIHSMVGSCPLITTWNFTVPESVPSGRAVFAWTWFSEQAGGPEMYMNCAPVEITGGADDDSAFSKLPNMLQANYDGAPEGCSKSSAGGNFDLLFPDPGESVETNFRAMLVEPSYAVDTSTFYACGKTRTPWTISSEGATPTMSSSASAAAANAGGVFAEGGAASASDATPTAPSATVSATATAAAASGSPSPGNNAAEPTPTAAQPVSATGDSQTACKSAKDGDLVCNGTSQFGFCNWGKVVWQAVADGTVCENGTIKAAKTARDHMIGRGAGGAAGHLHFHGRYSAGMRRRHIVG
ncbi:hypothetical protein SLS55_010540 [Diplodia seriata]|uniref:Lytic polysaccharide monooxygenase n=1 Tax=Diplodia seriata TaxID=420778 RepID=A0A1S8BQ56_9PEZI|nr:hypothetical protein BK809_0000011 [Diplodia seriata]